MAQAQRSEERYAAAAARVYANDRLEVLWEPSYCIHWAACIRGSRKVFNPQRRPWIDVDAETPERIAEIVRHCPTGALHVRWKDGTPAETPAEPLVAMPTLDGPLFLRGNIQLIDREGRVIREDTRLALCRCGHSQNKPFCDNSHVAAGFQSADEHLGPEPEDPDAFGDR